MDFPTIANSVLWIALTLCCYCIALIVAKKVHFNPVFHPIVLTVALLSVLIMLSEMPISEFQTSAHLLHWLLGPATVALAVPIHNQWKRIAQLGWNIWISIGIGGIVAPLLAWFSLYTFSAPKTVQITIVLKSVSTPFAMATAEAIGGIGELAAVFVIVTGIVGAIVAQVIFRVLGVTNTSAQGLALGTVGHAIGVSRSIQMGEETAAMAVIAMCINGVVTVLVLPFVFLWFLNA